MEKSKDFLSAWRAHGAHLLIYTMHTIFIKILWKFNSNKNIKQLIFNRCVITKPSNQPINQSYCDRHNKFAVAHFSRVERRRCSYIDDLRLIEHNDEIAYFRRVFRPISLIEQFCVWRVIERIKDSKTVDNRSFWDINCKKLKAKQLAIKQKSLATRLIQKHPKLTVGLRSY